LLDYSNRDIRNDKKRGFTLGLFREGTVIIIGAGASVPFGLPTGLSLIDDGVKVIRDEALALERFAKADPVAYVRNLPHFAPVFYAWKHDGVPTIDIEPSNAAHELTEQANWLAAQTSDTIDDVIRHNPDRTALLKAVTVFVLLRATHDAVSRKYYEPRNFGSRLLPKDKRNWIHGLINLARAELIDEWETTSPPMHKIKIVSFNYDGVLEKVLDQCWKSVESKFGSWHDYFSIIHPHGVIPIAEGTVQLRDVPKHLADNSKNIAVVHDGISQLPEPIRNDRSVARAWCLRVDQIYAIGFAFAKSNLRLLRLDKWLQIDKSGYTDPEEREFHYINYDGSSGLRARVAYLCNLRHLEHETGDFARNTPYEMRPLPNEKLEIADAIMGGFLGEMPS
jgi:hypothetical protein